MLMNKGRIGVRERVATELMVCLLIRSCGSVDQFIRLFLVTISAICLVANKTTNPLTVVQCRVAESFPRFVRDA
jgi:hypothetical protein